MKYNRFLSSVYSYLAMALTASMFAACTPEEMDGGLAPAPKSEAVQFTATPTTDNANIMSV
jgi:hypothetical protein